MSNQTPAIDLSSIANLLDNTIDALADMPEFKPFPKGAHRCTIKWAIKAINGYPAIELSLKAISTEELVDPTDTPVKAGDETSSIFILIGKDGTQNDLGQGQWKKLLVPLTAHFNTATNQETMDASQGCEVVAITGIQTNKKDPQNIKHYTSIEQLMVV